MLHKNIMTQLIIFLLLAVSVLPAQSRRHIQLPRCADISIAGIYFEDHESAERVLGPNIALIDSLDLPQARYYNRHKSEALTLILHPGAARNEFSEFRVTYAHSLSESATFQETKLSHFTTGKGVKLGLEERTLRQILGNTASRAVEGNIVVLRYRLDNFDSSQFLRHYNMPIYSGEYRFRNGKLFEFSFGFEYP